MNIKKKLAESLDAYIKLKHTQEECSGFIDGFEKCCEYASRQNEWVSVEMALPEVNQDSKWDIENFISKKVIVYMAGDYKETRFAVHYSNPNFTHWVVEGCAGFDQKIITHWKAIGLPITKPTE